MTETQQEPIVRLQQVTAGGSALIWPVAPQFLEEEGVEFEYIDIGTADNAVALLTERTDFALLGPLDVAGLRNQGADVTILAPLFNQFNAIYAKADDDRTLEQLQGEQIGDYGPGSSTVHQYQVLMAMDGLDYSTYFEQVSAAPPTLPALLDRGDVDIVAVGPTINLPLAARPDEYRVVYGPLAERWRDATGFPLLLAGMATTERFIEAHPELVAKVLSALSSTTAYIVENPESVLEEHGDLLGIETDAEREVTVNLLTEGPLYQSELSEERLESEQQFLDEALEAGVIETIPDGIWYCEDNPTSPICEVAKG